MTPFTDMVKLPAWISNYIHCKVCNKIIYLTSTVVPGICNHHFDVHGETTEEGNCSYLLPRAAAAGSNGTNKGQIHKVPVDEMARYFVYRMDVTRSQLGANNGVPVSLVREIWQFKVFTGKEVTPLHEEGNS